MSLRFSLPPFFAGPRRCKQGPSPKQALVPSIVVSTAWRQGPRPKAQMHSLDACWVFWCPSVSCGCFPRMPLTVVSYRCTSGFPRCPTVPRLLGVYKCFYGCFLRSFPTVASYGSLRFRRVPVIRVSFRFLRFPTASCGYVLRLPVLGSHVFLQFLWFFLRFL